MQEDVQDDGDDAGRLLDAMLVHVPFEGWSDASLDAAAADLGLGRAEVTALAPGGAVGMAAAYHRRLDGRMRARLAAADLASLRFRDRVALALRFWLEGADREAVRRGSTLFALPQHSARAARLVWGTVDAIWTALGDSSADVNWYTKRLTLAGVFPAVVLYWLGDRSAGAADTRDFIDRRIAGVMRIESAKAALRKLPGMAPFLAGPFNPLNRVRAPKGRPQDAPGRWTR